MVEIAKRREVLDDLESYRIACKRIENLQEQRERLKNLAFSLGSGTGGGGGHTSGPKDARYAKSIIALADLDAELDADIKGLQYALQRTKRRIAQCSVKNGKNVLEMFYIDRMTAMDISIALDKTEQHIFKIKRNAIDQIVKSE